MYTNDDLVKLSPEDKKKMRSSFQMEIIMKESDLKKINLRKSTLDSEIRKLNYDEERLRIELDQKKKEFDRAIQQITEQEEEIKRIRKKMNLLAG